jgi:wyosine [tRNA(Phe)-imidazoG37] synthetase (radical SAM superfamily)
VRQSAYRWRLVYATDDGELHEDESLFALGASGLHSVPLGRMIPLPEGATVSLLPGSRVVGRALDGREVTHPAPGARAVAALLPTGFTRLLTPAYVKDIDAGHMPLFGYTAVASLHGKLFAAALPLDPGGAWNPALHNTDDLPALVQARVTAAPDNRLLAHHAYCATEYGCYTAQNLFYGRDEMAIAVSVACNAQCVGCISEQLDDITSPHDRIRFTPRLDEIVSLAVPHLQQAPDPIVSFGQGCEGEPLLRARLIGRAIEAIRRETPRGQIHINTNGSNPRALQHLVDMGLDSVRVSMFSAIERNHVAYYGPRNYDLRDMEESLRLARRQGLHTSVNLLAYPGFTDCPSEVEELIRFFRRGEVQMVQMRTLNMDRELLQEKVGFPDEWGIGIQAAMERFAGEVPGLTLASHTPFVGRAHAYVS